MKQRFFVSLLCLFFVHFVRAQETASLWYVYTRANQTLGLVYDVTAPAMFRGQSVTQVIKYQPVNNNNPVVDGEMRNATSVVVDDNVATWQPTSMRSLFSSLSRVVNIEGLEKLNTSNVVDLSFMFNLCTSLTSLDVSSFNTENVTNMNSVFRYCSSLPVLDVSGFHTEKVTAMRAMFERCSSLPSLDVSSFNTKRVTDMGYMFANCSSLTSLNVSGVNTDQVADMNYMFSGCSALPLLDITGFNTNKVLTMNSMFRDCFALTALDVTGFNTENVTNMSAMFYNCRALRSLNVSSFNTEKVTTMKSMFERCSVLSSLDLSSFNTKNVTDMASMFSICGALTSLNVSSFNTEKVTDMSSMFNLCRSLPSLDVSSFNTESVTNMRYMFNSCLALPSLDVSGFNTSKVTTMGSMFSGCGTLTSLNVSGFNTENVTDMSGMFYNCRSLPSLNVSGFNTENVTNMGSMFNSCSSLKALNVTNFKTGKVTTMGNMFSGCSALTSLDVSSFKTSKVKNMDFMFSKCHRLDSLNLATFDGGLLTTATNIFGELYNAQYIDLSRTTNAAKIVDAYLAQGDKRNPYRLVYLPKGVTRHNAPNLIYYDGHSFTTAEYKVTDDTTRHSSRADNFDDFSGMRWEVNIPHAFTAQKVTNSRTIAGAANRPYTWFMPYDAPIPANVTAYEFQATSVDASGSQPVVTFVRTPGPQLHAQKPYLLVGQGSEVSTSVDNGTPVSVPAYKPGTDVSAAATSGGWSFVGTFQWRTVEQAANEGLHGLKAAESKWKVYDKVQTTVRPQPLRAYLKHLGSGGAPELLMNFENGITDLTRIELRDEAKPEESRIFDLNGRYLGTRREVLPAGVYIIGGQKTAVTTNH